MFVPSNLSAIYMYISKESKYKSFGKSTYYKYFTIDIECCFGIFIWVILKKRVFL